MSAKIDSFSHDFGVMKQKLDTLNTSVNTLRSDIADMKKKEEERYDKMNKQVSRIKQNQTKMQVITGLLSGGAVVALIGLIKKFINVF